jgi:hypothetical protein
MGMALTVPRVNSEIMRTAAEAMVRRSRLWRVAKVLAWTINAELPLISPPVPAASAVSGPPRVYDRKLPGRVLPCLGPSVRKMGHSGAV